MHFYRHYSGTDEGEFCVLASIRFQPESVLGLLLFSGSAGKDIAANGAWDFLDEFADEFADQLSKYQCALVLSYGSNIFDIQATLYHYRYPKAHLKALCQLIPKVPVYYSSKLPEGATSISDFHKMNDQPFKRFLFGYQADDRYFNPGLREEISALIGKGIRAKTA